MTRVNINGGHHQVEIEDDGKLSDIVRTARKLWRDTMPDGAGTVGPAFGFTGERRDGRDLYPQDLDGK